MQLPFFVTMPSSGSPLELLVAFQVAFPFVAAFVEIAPGLYAACCTGLDMFVAGGGIIVGVQCLPFASQSLKNNSFIVQILLDLHINSSYPPSNF